MWHFLRILWICTVLLRQNLILNYFRMLSIVGRTVLTSIYRVLFIEKHFLNLFRMDCHHQNGWAKSGLIGSIHFCVDSLYFNFSFLQEKKLSFIHSCNLSLWLWKNVRFAWGWMLREVIKEKPSMTSLCNYCVNESESPLALVPVCHLRQTTRTKKFVLDENLHTNKLDKNIRS